MCAFRRITHRPCPSCGSTRAVLALLQMDIARALAYNPLTMIVMLILAMLALLRLLLARTIRCRFSSQSEKVTAAILAGLILLANWLYLLYHLPPT